MGFSVHPGPSMRERTTLRLGGHALAEVLISDADALDTLPDTLRSLGGIPFVLGRGSNLLARDGELGVVLLRMRQEPRPEVLQQDPRQSLVRVPAGMSLQRLLHWLARRGLGGMQGLSGVPGDVGGAVAMNAGSFGCTIGDCLQRVQVLRRAGGIWSLDWLGADSFCTTYRSFALQPRPDFFLITMAELALPHMEAELISRTMRENLAKKRATQPITAWTAGCAFKNPAADTPAGMLLDKAGLKGFEVGGMAFSTMHANFLVNTGNGTSTAALELLELARSRVRERFGQTLELEVKLCPHT